MHVHGEVRVEPDNYNAYRSKLVASAQGGGGPKHHEEGEGLVFPNVHSAGRLDTTDPVPSDIVSEIERMRQTARTKQSEMLKLRAENILLKQVERRQQKEIEGLQSEFIDAPRIIKGLREQIMGLKHKLKEVYAQHSSGERSMRHQNDAFIKLKEENQRYLKLIEDEDLAGREELSKDLEMGKDEIARQQKMLIDLTHRSELVEKNLKLENERFRTRLRSLEKENQVIQDLVSRLEEKSKEKDKEIASLSIYRYNMVHKRNETVESCKSCQKREKEDAELERLKASVTIPVPSNTSLRVLSGSSLEATVTIPDLGTDTADSHGHEYHSAKSVVFTCAEDEQITSNVRSVVVPAEGATKSNIHVDASEGDQQSKPGNFEVRGYFNELEAGKFYFVKAAVRIDNRTGQVGKVESIYLDVVPTAPPAPKVEIEKYINSAKPQTGQTSSTADAAIIKITVRPATSNSSGNGTALTAYRIYHYCQNPTPSHSEDNNESIRHWFLLEEIPVESEDLSYRYVDPKSGVPHLFCCTAVNQAGESVQGPHSDPVVIDVPPLCPPAPRVQKVTPQKIRASIVPPSENGGSPVQSYRVICAAIPDEGDVTDQLTRNIIPAPGTQGVVEFDDLKPNASYAVRVIAINAQGESETGPPSEIVTLGHVFPTPEPPRHELLENGIRLIFDELKQDNVNAKPQIEGREVIYSRDEKAVLNNRNVTTVRLPVDTLSCDVKELKYGRSYWFALSYYSADESGAASKAIKIRAPERTVSHEQDVPTSDVPSLEKTESTSSLSTTGRLSKANSRSIDLSFDQKVINMHRGIPSQQVPPELLAADESALQTDSAVRNALGEPATLPDNLLLGRRASRHGSLESIGGRKASDPHAHLLHSGTSPSFAAVQPSPRIAHGETPLPENLGRRASRRRQSTDKFGTKRT